MSIIINYNKLDALDNIKKHHKFRSSPGSTLKLKKHYNRLKRSKSFIDKGAKLSGIEVIFPQLKKSNWTMAPISLDIESKDIQDHLIDQIIFFQNMYDVFRGAWILERLCLYNHYNQQRYFIADYRHYMSTNDFLAHFMVRLVDKYNTWYLDAHPEIDLLIQFMRKCDNITLFDVDILDNQEYYQDNKAESLYPIGPSGQLTSSQGYFELKIVRPQIISPKSFGETIDLEIYVRGPAQRGFFIVGNNKLQASSLRLSSGTGTYFEPLREHHLVISVDNYSDNPVALRPGECYFWLVMTSGQATITMQRVSVCTLSVNLKD